MEAVPTSPTTGDVTLNPPPTGGPVDMYEVTLCPISGGPCMVETCPTIQCPVDGLTPNTPYQVTAVPIVDGVRLPQTNPVEMTTPPLGAPTLTSAQDTSPTTGTATADPPPGVTFTSVRV